MSMIEDDFISQQKIGIRFSAQNSDNLFNSAELLITQHFYSPAIPILILSAEEIIKSFALCLEIFLGDNAEVKKIIPDAKLRDSDSYMNNHIVKHQLAKTLITDIRKISPIVEILRFIPSKTINTILEIISISKSQEIQIDSLLNELKNFNAKKNDGFYVNKKGNNWYTPLTLTDQDCDKVFQTASLIRDIFLPKIRQILTFSDLELAGVYEITKNQNLK